MNEVRRGYAVLLAGGDAEISEALARGIAEGRAAQRRPYGERVENDGRPLPSALRAATFPRGEGLEGCAGLTDRQREIVRAEIDRISILEGLRGQAQGVAQDAPVTRDQGDSRQARGVQAITEAVGHREAVERALLRVAVGNAKTAADYARMRCEAEFDYGERLDEPGPLRRIADRALGIYGLFVYAVAEAYRAQDKLLGG